MQGNCSSELPASFGMLNPALVSTPVMGQCVIVAPFDLFYFRDNAAYQVWMDNLLLRLGSHPPRSALGGTLVLFEPKPKTESQLWLTHVSFEGDGGPSSRAAFPISPTSSNSMYVAGVQPTSQVISISVLPNLLKIIYSPLACQSRCSCGQVSAGCLAPAELL